MLLDDDEYQLTVWRISLAELALQLWYYDGFWFEEEAWCCKNIKKGDTWCATWFFNYSTRGGGCFHLSFGGFAGFRRGEEWEENREAAAAYTHKEKRKLSISATKASKPVIWHAWTTTATTLVLHAIVRSYTSLWLHALNRSFLISDMTTAAAAALLLVRQRRGGGDVPGSITSSCTTHNAAASF